MVDSSLIIQELRDEITTYSDSRSAAKKILFNKTDPSLFSKLQELLSELLELEDLEQMEIDEVYSQLIKYLGWEDDN